MTVAEEHDRLYIAEELGHPYIAAASADTPVARHILGELVVEKRVHIGPLLNSARFFQLVQRILYL